MLERKFEKYRGGPTRDPNERLHVTLAPNGRLFINKRVHELIGKPNAVFLYFSRADDQIAIQPTRASSPEAMPLFDNKQGWRVNAAPFCRHFGIQLHETQKFIHPQITDGGLILKLGETVTVTNVMKGRTRRKP